MGSGDVLSQFLIEKKTMKGFDNVRAGRFFLVGTFFTVC